MRFAHSLPAIAGLLSLLAVAPVARGGGCVRTITSPDGLWTACVDPFGQVTDLIPPDQPGVDNLFETLVYEAAEHNNQLSRRVETSYVVAESVNNPDSTFTRLEKSDFPLSIEITNQMIDGPTGGVLVTIEAINKGPKPHGVKLFYYCDFDISGSFGDDEASLVIDPDTDRLVAIEQIDTGAEPKPLWFGGCPNYKSWEIDTFALLRDRLDTGVIQLAGADFTAPGPADHTAALSSSKMILEPGEALTMVVGIGAAGFTDCPTSPTCPWDLDGDGIVGITDLITLLSRWGPNPGNPADFDDDGIVGITDLIKLLGNWGPCPGTILAGTDCFFTPPGAGQVTFSPATIPLPANFFGPGSDPFVGAVPLQGNGAEPDTVVQRLEHLPLPEIGSQVSIPIEIVQLDLVSVDPIIVTYDGGQMPQEWDVEVTLSDLPPPPPGQMTVTREHENGGTFSSQLPVQPKFTFIQVQNPGNTLSFDLEPPLLTLDPLAPWVYDLSPETPVIPCTPGFAPGVEDLVPGDPLQGQCCRPVCNQDVPMQFCGLAGLGCTPCPPP